VLIAVDGIRNAILTAVESGSISARKVAIISTAHSAFFAIDGNFAPFEVMRFMPRELAASYALRDAVLLIFLPLMDRRRGLAHANAGRNCEGRSSKQGQLHKSVLLGATGLLRLCF
jgi:hypothetical protein